MTKLGGKKKHKRSMENLLAVDEANEGAAKGSIESPRGEHLEEEDGGVVPLEMQRDIEGKCFAVYSSSSLHPIALCIELCPDLSCRFSDDR